MNWILTEDKLREKLDAKAARYTKYVERIHKNHAKLNQEIKPPIPDLDKLNFDCIDEFNILNFYMTKMIEEIEKIFVTRKFEIYHYALTLIRRYYLQNTLLDTHAREMMYTCIIVAVKLSENKSMRLSTSDKKICQDIFEYAEKCWKEYKITTRRRRSNYYKQ